MKSQQPSLRFRLHQAAVTAFKAEPPPPVAVNAETKREHKAATQRHYDHALRTALGLPLVMLPHRYERYIFNGILHRLRGQQTAVKPLYSKNEIMPHMRAWAEKRGLI